MIQAYYKYRPTSFEALALLVCADGKDRIIQMYAAEMMRLAASVYYSDLPVLADVLTAKPRKRVTAENANDFVDMMIRTFGKGGGK